jgi:hypothetical protein
MGVSPAKIFSRGKLGSAIKQVKLGLFVAAAAI